MQELKSTWGEQKSDFRSLWCLLQHAGWHEAEKTHALVFLWSSALWNMWLLFMRMSPETLFCSADRQQAGATLMYCAETLSEVDKKINFLNSAVCRDKLGHVQAAAAGQWVALTFHFLLVADVFDKGRSSVQHCFILHPAKQKQKTWTWKTEYWEKVESAIISLYFVFSQASILENFLKSRIKQNVLDFQKIFFHISTQFRTLTSESFRHKSYAYCSLASSEEKEPLDMISVCVEDNSSATTCD